MPNGLIEFGSGNRLHTNFFRRWKEGSWRRLDDELMEVTFGTKTHILELTWDEQPTFRVTRRWAVITRKEFPVWGANGVIVS